MSRLAVVLFNLGGPDGPDAVQPFLFNLFNDPAILSMPGPLRHLLASVISKRRAPLAKAIYGKLGGSSPLLDRTKEQAVALQERLRGDDAVRVFIAMRYWHPRSDEAAREVRAFGANEVVLLPLYPQFSTTTTASSLRDWERAARLHGLRVPTRVICCYPTEMGLVRTHAGLLKEGLKQARAEAGRDARAPRVLFSAHGLPERIVRTGDPYPWQVGQSAAAIVADLDVADLDWVVCYQSRVGPLKWIGPSIEEELDRAATDAVPVVVVPIAFVSEHAETLVELDMEYAHRARALGVPAYVRVPALGSRDRFIDGLAHLVGVARTGRSSPLSGTGERLCPRDMRVRCPCV